MKKYFFVAVGILIGLSLSLVITTNAADVKSVIGKAIQGEFPIKLDGKQLDKKAIVIEGTSYLPVRALSEALNMDITFNADLGIEIKRKGIIPMTTDNSNVSVTEDTYEDINGKRKIIQSSLDSYNQMLNTYQSDLDKLNSKVEKSDYDNLVINQKIVAISKTKEAIKNIEKQLLDLLK